MNIKENKYLQDFIGTSIGVIGSNIAFSAYDLKIFQSLLDFGKWILIIFVLALFIILVKWIFKWIAVNGLFDGLWIGTALYCFEKAFILFTEKGFEASIIPIIIGIGVLVGGYYFNKKLRPYWDDS